MADLLRRGARRRLDGRGAYLHFDRITTRWPEKDVYGHVNNVVDHSWFDTTVNRCLIERDMLDIHQATTKALPWRRATSCTSASTDAVGARCAATAAAHGAGQGLVALPATDFLG